MWLIDGFGILITCGLFYGLAVIWCCVRDIKIERTRRTEQEERRRIQREQWDAQLVENPNFHIMLIRARAGLSNFREEDRVLLNELRIRLREQQEPIPRVNWKKEGF